MLLALALYLSFCHSFSAAQNLPYKAVNLGNWLLTEGWMEPSLFDGITNKDLLVFSIIISLVFITVATWHLHILYYSSNFQVYNVWSFQDGTQVQFMSTKLQRYLTAENGGGADVVANRNSASGWETFRVRL